MNMSKLKQKAGESSGRQDASIKSQEAGDASMSYRAYKMRQSEQYL